MGVKRRLACSARFKRTRTCILCDGTTIFEYHPSLRFAPPDLSPELALALSSPTSYYCPLCKTDVYSLKQEPTSSGPSTLPEGALKSKSAWLFAKLVKSGIDPYVALDVQSSSVTALDSITAAETIMAEKANMALLSLAQNLSREFGQPKRTEMDSTAMLESLTNLKTLPIIKEACTDVRTAGCMVKTGFQSNPVVSTWLQGV